MMIMMMAIMYEVASFLKLENYISASCINIEKHKSNNMYYTKFCVFMVSVGPEDATVWLMSISES